MIIVNETNDNGDTALSMASKSHNANAAITNAIKALLLTHGATENASDSA